jgi:hypothetical protein
MKSATHARVTVIPFGAMGNQEIAEVAVITAAFALKPPITHGTHAIP